MKYELLLAPLVSWFVAQGLKFAISLRKDGVQFRDLYASGGFPSSHTAFASSVMMLIGLRRGFGSTEFAIIAVVTAIVMYDAIGVRRSSGQNSAAIKELAAKSKIKLDTVINRAKGHLPQEVVAGFIVGALVSVVFYHLS